MRTKVVNVRRTPETVAFRDIPRYSWLRVSDNGNVGIKIDDRTIHFFASLKSEDSADGPCTLVSAQKHYEVLTDVTVTVND